MMPVTEAFISEEAKVRIAAGNLIRLIEGILK
jgi:hypothetical protein